MIAENNYTFYAFYAFYAWWIYFLQSGALAEGHRVTGYIAASVSQA
jgi:hypothetical protein